MNSPADLSQRLARQWQNPDLRETRLVGNELWPVHLPVGRPPVKLVTGDWPAVVEHIKQWRSVPTGRVIWEPINYRATGGAFEIPVAWEIDSPGEWVEAAADRAVAAEFSVLTRILNSVDPLFHGMFIRQRSLWRDKPVAEILKAASLAMLLEPGCAQETPLRALSIGGIDSKFFERHRGLLVRLLDLRFDGEAGVQGLETFLNAWQESDHWLLVVDLDGNLLPFSQQRVRSSELAAASIAVTRLLIVENERCLHLLPRPLPGGIGVLGAGNNLRWLSASWIHSARVAYWGDIDTWGLTLLSNARKMVPALRAILMDRSVFDNYAESCAVSEQVTASSVPPDGLHPSERDLYRYLQTCERGRLEQEFIRAEDVVRSLEGAFSEEPRA